MIAVAVLAHQGGWDEMLFVLVPILVVAVLLRIAKRRMVRVTAEQNDPLASPEPASPEQAVGPADSATAPVGAGSETSDAGPDGR